MKPKARRSLLTMMPFSKTFLVDALLFISPAGFAQDQVIKLQQRKTTLKTLIAATEKQTNKSVGYGQSAINLKKVVQASSNKIKLSDLLQELFKDTDVDRTITDHHILINEEPKAKVSASAQDQATTKVTGQVVDRNGESLPGVTVRVKGTKNATTTDIDDNYALSAAKNNMIGFSYVDFATRGFKATDITAQTVLSESSKGLNEVVVTALGIKHEEKVLSYNAQQVKGGNLLTNEDTNFINSLSGGVAGVNISASSSGVGDVSKVVIRGMRSISQSSNVLYVIDGIPILNADREGGKEFDSRGTSEDIANINPEDIGSMSVLTSAAAAVLYGEKASNGTVVIATKRGKAGKTVFTVSQTAELSDAFAMPRFQNRCGTGSMPREDGVSSYSWDELLNEADYQGYNPVADYLEVGIVTTETVTSSTGMDRNRTPLSASTLNVNGVVPNSHCSRYSFTARDTTNLLNDKLTLDLEASFILRNGCNMINQGVYNNPLITAYLYPRGNPYEDVAMFERYGSQRRIYVQNWGDLISEFVGQNPYWVNYRTPRTTSKRRCIMNTNATCTVTSWLDLSARTRIDHNASTCDERFYATTNKTFTGSENGLYGISKTANRQIYGDMMATVDECFFEDRLSLSTNLSVSSQGQCEGLLGVRGPISEKLIPNVLTTTQIDRTQLKPEPAGYHN